MTDEGLAALAPLGASLTALDLGYSCWSHTAAGLAALLQRTPRLRMLNIGAAAGGWAGGAMAGALHAAACWQRARCASLPAEPDLPCRLPAAPTAPRSRRRVRGHVRRRGGRRGAALPRAARAGCVGEPAHDRRRRAPAGQGAGRPGAGAAAAACSDPSGPASCVAPPRCALELYWRCFKPAAARPAGAAAWPECVPCLTATPCCRLPAHPLQLAQLRDLLLGWNIRLRDDALDALPASISRLVRARGLPSLRPWLRAAALPRGWRPREGPSSRRQLAGWLGTRRARPPRRRPCPLPPPSPPARRAAALTPCPRPHPLPPPSRTCPSAVR